MKYTDLEKEQLGKLFKYYRIKNKVKWSNIEKSKISSLATYSKMEKGLPVKDEFYDKYLAFYNLVYKRKDNFYEWITPYLEKVNHAFIWNEMELFESLEDELNKELLNFKSTPIYEQLYIILHHLFEYYRYGHYMTYQDNEMNLILCELGISNQDLASELLEVMFVSYNNSISEEGQNEDIIKAANQYKNKYFLNYIYAINEKYGCNFYKALNLLKESYEYWKSQNNHYREVRYLNIIYLIYSDIDKEEARKTAPILLKYLDDNTLPKTLKDAILYNIAMFDYLNKRYEEAYELFMRIVQEYNGVNELVYIGSICTHLNRELPNVILDTEINGYKQELSIKYFQMKKNGQKDDILVGYIIDTLIPNKLKDIPYKYPDWDIFEYELEVLSKNNKKFFNDYMKYKEYMHTICIDG